MLDSDWLKGFYQKSDSGHLKKTWTIGGQMLFISQFITIGRQCDSMMDRQVSPSNFTINSIAAFTIILNVVCCLFCLFYRIA